MAYSKRYAPVRSVKSKYAPNPKGGIAYSRKIWGRALRNGLGSAVKMLAGVVVALVTLGLQFGLGLVPSGDGAARWLALIAGQCVGFGLLAVGFIWHAAWEQHKEHLDHIDRFERRQEDFARLQAANTLFNSASRLANMAALSSAEYPLKPDAGDEGFRMQYRWYLLLITDSFLSVPRDSVDPLPLEQSWQTRQEISRALAVHISWLRDYAATLRADLSQRAMTS